MPTTKARGRKSARIVLLAGTAVYTDFKNIKNNSDGRGERRGEEKRRGGDLENCVRRLVPGLTKHPRCKAKSWHQIFT